MSSHQLNNGMPEAHDGGPMNLSDIERALDYLKHAFGGKIRRHVDNLLRGGPVDADDVWQEIVLKFLKLRGPENGFNDECHAEAWLYAAANCTCFDLFRKADARRRYEESVRAGSPPTGDDPSGRLQRVEQTAHVIMAVGALPPEFRKAVVLRFYEDLSYDEIATRCGCPSKTAGSRISRAKRLMRSPPVANAMQRDLAVSVAQITENCDLKTAVAMLGKILEHCPQTCVAFIAHCRGMARQMAGDIPGAFEDFTKAIAAEEPDLPWVRPMSFFSRANLEMEMAALLMKSPTLLVESRGERVITHRHCAISDFSAALESPCLDEKVKAMALQGRGLARGSSNDLIGAIGDYNQVLELEEVPVDTRVACIFNRGLARELLNDTDGALEDYRSVAENENASVPDRQKSWRKAADIAAAIDRDLAARTLWQTQEESRPTYVVGPGVYIACDTRDSARDC